MPILFATILIDLIGFGIVIPILPFMAPQLGADKMDIAFLIVAYAVCGGLCGPYWGRLSDRLGRKPVMMICLAGAAVSYVMLGLSTELWMIYCARAFAGLMAGNFGVVSAMIADLTTPANRARGMGMLGAAFGMGLVIGPVLGGLLSGPDNTFTVPCIVAGLMSVLALIAAQLFLRESLSAEKRQQNREHHRSVPLQSVFTMLRETGNRLMVAQFTLHTTCVSSVTYLLPLWVGDELGWGARETGMVFGAQGLIMAILQGGLIGPLAARFGELPFLRAGTVRDDKWLPAGSVCRWRRYDGGVLHYRRDRGYFLHAHPQYHCDHAHSAPTAWAHDGNHRICGILGPGLRPVVCGGQFAILWL